MGQRVVLYARLSKADPGSHSIRSQLADMRRYAKLYHHDIIAEITDDGYSAATLDRPGMLRVVDMIEAGEVDAVIVLKLDRLTRSIADLGRLLDTFRARSVSLASVQERLDTSTAGGRFTVGILGLVSQWERESISERTKAALAQRKRDGLHVGRPAYGWRVHDGDLVRDESAQRALRRMRKLKRQGRSLRDICHALDSEAVPTPSGSASWAPSTVARLTA
jgi:site-specific DNA recombinase